MASYDLNEELKKRKSTQTGAEKSLDDVSRVKVLSPSRKVFKRFIRNRLAVFGAVTLIALFLFSFAGPLFYPYGQKEIFYTFSKQNVNYALAKKNTAFNGYDTDDSIEVDTLVTTSMNSNIKKMLSDGTEEMTIPGDEGGWLIRMETPDIFTLSGVDLEKVADAGESTVKVGTYSMIGKEFTAEGDEIPGLAEAAADQIKGTSGSFEAGGVTYTFDKGAKPKTFDVFAQADGIIYEGKEPGGDFEKELGRAMEEGASSFEAGGKSYVISKKGASASVYTVGEAKTAMVYTDLTLDTVKTGGSVPADFKAAALLAAAEGGGEFTSGGETYSILPDEDGDILMVQDASGEPFGEFGQYSVRRYSGEDTMDFDLKQAIAGKIDEMMDEGIQNGTLQAMIPTQNEDGSYSRDENGDFILNETEMKITQRLEGEYVINCDQINYVIDIYAPPSAKHPLGTDGDGFDVLARVMYGGRVSLMVGFVVVFIETFLGVIMGGIAGFFGGWVDNLIMRMVDIFYCLPMMPIMIILGSMMDALRMDTYVRLIIMMAALGLMGWAGVARLVRGQILSLREQEFMVATEATGIKVRARIFRHLVPNVLPQLIVTATMGLGGVILTESTLSFLGLGVKHPLATWGTIINSVSSASAMAHYAHIWIPVGLLICLTVIAFNFVGDGLRDAYDPKSKR